MFCAMSTVRESLARRYDAVMGSPRSVETSPLREMAMETRRKFDQDFKEGSVPRLSARRADPHLVLDRVAAGGVFLGLGGQALPGEAAGCLADLPGGLHLHAEVIHHRRLPLLAFEEHQLQRRLGDGEVCIARAALSRPGAEQPGVEVDRRLKVSDPERELDTGHGSSS